MRITVLGSGAAYPRPGGACAGFLVSSGPRSSPGSTNVWVDAGNGTFSNLQKYIGYRDVDALVLTHGHADHIADVLPFMYALGFDPERAPATVPVFAPEDVAPAIASSLGGTSRARFKAVFDFHAIEKRFEARDVTFEPFRTQHPTETYGLRMTCEGKVAVYTSDTALFPDLAGACKDADLLISEATFIDGVEADPGIHMSAREAGRVAKEAGVKRLVLTHIWPTFDPERAVLEAAASYDGPIEAAVEGKVYEL